MINIAINYIFIATFSVLLIIAAIKDARQFIIPNWLPASLTMLFLLAVGFGWTQEISLFPTSLWLHILTMAGVLIFFTILFATGQMGGGDVKLIAAVSLWAGPYYVFDFILITALAGGVIAAIQLIRGGMQKKSIANYTGDDLQQNEQAVQKAVPYGIAIGFGGIFCAQQLLNQFN